MDSNIVGPNSKSGYPAAPSRGRSISVAGRGAGDGQLNQQPKGDHHSTNYPDVTASNTTSRSGSVPGQGNVRGYSTTSTAGGRTLINGNSRRGGGESTIKRIS